MPYMVCNTELSADENLALHGNECVFETGSGAKLKADYLNAYAKEHGSPIRWRVIPWNVDRSWIKREEERFAIGYYDPMPEGWPKIGTHFLHPSKENPRYVAFTPDDQWGASDRKRRVSPGRYLDQFRGAADPYITAIEARRLEESYRARYIPVDTVKFATTPDEIEEVYTNGPNSCMSHDAEDYESSIHPVRVYGAGDLAIAYIEDEDDELDNDSRGHIVARAICWPKKKIYGRIYGDYSRLTKGLQALDYEPVKGDGFDGARLLKIEENGKFVGPYFDPPMEGVVEEGKYLVVSTDYEHCCRNTEGYIYKSFGHCANCDETLYENDGDYEEIGGELYCRCCYNDRFFYCHSCEETHSTEDMVDVADHGVMCSSCAEERARYCDTCDQRFLAEDMHDDDMCKNCHHRVVAENLIAQAMQNDTVPGRVAPSVYWYKSLESPQYAYFYPQSREAREYFGDRWFSFSYGAYHLPTEYSNHTLLSHLTFQELEINEPEPNQLDLGV